MEKYRILTKTQTIPRLDEKTILQKALLVPMRRMGTRTPLRRSPKLTKSNQDATHLTRVTMRRMVTRKTRKFECLFAFAFMPASFFVGCTPCTNRTF